MRDLQKIAVECMQELDRIGIPYGNIERFIVNTRATKRWGQCKKLPSGNFEININQDLLDEKNSLEGLKNTIMHELLHSCEGCMNHGKKWQDMANKVNKFYGCKIKRVSSASEKGVIKHTKKPIVYKYNVFCNSCKRNYKYQRMCWSVECCTTGDAKCICGSNSFTVKKL